MTQVRLRSVEDPFDTPDAVRPALEALTLAAAMGLLPEGDDVQVLDLAAVRRLARTAGESGIAPGATATLLGRRFDGLGAGTSRGRAPGEARLRELLAAIEQLKDGLEESPVPEFEWRSLGKLFDLEELAALVGTSVSSLRRYTSGARETPDDVAARLHFVAKVVADLRGSYNDVGVRRWFRRKRTLLEGRAPADILAGSWEPEDLGPAEVRALARSLMSSPAT